MPEREKLREREREERGIERGGQLTQAWLIFYTKKRVI